MADTLFTDTNVSKTISPVKISPSEPLIGMSVDPAALSTGLVMAAVFGAENGATPAECEEVILLIRGQDLILAADWDSSFSATVDGLERPMRFRLKISGSRSSGQDQVAWVCARVRTAELLVALRNKIENSELYSVLGDKVDISVLANSHGTAPGQIVVTPSDGGKARTVEIRSTVDPATIIDLEPTTSDSRVGNISPDTMLEMGLIASEEVGVYINPGSASMPSYMAGIGKRGAAVAAFDATVPDLTKGMNGTKGVGSGVVASARLMRAIGFLQEPVADLAKGSVKKKIAQEQAKVQAAFIAAALEETANLGVLYDAIGRNFARKVLSEGSGAGEDSVLDKAEAFAKKVVDEAGEKASLAIAGSILRTASGKVPDVLLGSIEEISNGSLVVSQLIRAYLGHNDVELRERSVAVAFGEQRVEQAAREISQIPEGEALRRPEVALGAVRAAGGKKTNEIIEELLSRIDNSLCDQWWGSMEAYCGQLRVSASVRRDLEDRKSKNNGQLPNISAVRISDSIRAAWTTEMVADVEGRLFGDATGRVGAGWVDDGGMSLTITDLAVDPDPAHYPMQPEQIKAVLGNSVKDFSLLATLYSSDLERTAGRVVGMTSPDKARGKGGDNISGPIFLAKWLPQGQAAEVLEKGGAGVVITPETAWVGSKSVSLPRKSFDFPIARVAEAGTLRIYGLAPDGESQYFSLPMKAIKNKDGLNDVIFAVNAEQLQELVSFSASVGRETILTVEDGLVRLSDPAHRHITMIPTTGIDRLPVSLQLVSQKIGLPGRTAMHPISQVIQQAARLATPRFSHAKTPIKATPGIGLREREEVVAVAGGMAVSPTIAGAKALAVDDAQRRHWDRELAELNAILADFPPLSDAELKASLKIHGTMGAVLGDLLNKPIIARQIHKSAASAPLRALVALLRERGLEAPILDAEPLDLFADKSAISGGAEDALVQDAWATFIGAARRVRRKLVIRKQDLEITRGIQMPVVHGEARAGGLTVQIIEGIVPEEGDVEASVVTRTEVRKKIRA